MSVYEMIIGWLGWAIIRFLSWSAGFAAFVLLWMALLYIPYLFITWPDRRRERIGFRLRILKFGLDNGLDGEGIVDALCEETRQSISKAAGIKKRLADGRSLIDALSMDRSLFPKSISCLLLAGEEMGNLTSALSYAEDHVELDRTIYSRMNMQFLYPLSLIIYPGFILSAMYAFVFPLFMDMMSELGVRGELPVFPSRLAVLIIWGAAGLCALGYLYFRHRLSERKSRLTFVQVLSTALARDMDEFTALDLAGQCSASRRLDRCSRRAQRMLGEGVGIAEAVSDSFPRGDEIAWFFNQSRRSDAVEVFKTWAGILRERLERRADVFSQAFSTLIVLCVGLLTCILAFFVFNAMIAILNVFL